MKNHALFSTSARPRELCWGPLEEDYDYQTLFPLHHAVSSGDLALVKECLTQEALNEKDLFGNTPLYVAIQEDRMGVFEFLVQQGADVGSVHLLHNNGSTPLHEALLVGDMRYVQRLLAQGAYVDNLSFRGTSPLYEAIEQRNLSGVKLLLEHGATVGVYERKKAGFVNNSEIIALLEQCWKKKI